MNPDNRLPPKFFHLIFTLVMGTMMVTLMTFVITLVNVGLTEDFLGKWAKAFLVAYPVALTVIYFLAPVARRLTLRWVRMA